MSREGKRKVVEFLPIVNPSGRKPLAGITADIIYGPIVDYASSFMDMEDWDSLEELLPLLKYLKSLGKSELTNLYLRPEELT